MGRTLHLSFFLSWVSKTQPNHWTKRMAIDTIFLFHSFFLLCSFFLSFFLLCSPFFLKLSSKSFWRRISKKICKKDFANSQKTMVFLPMFDVVPDLHSLACSDGWTCTSTDSSGTEYTGDNGWCAPWKALLFPLWRNTVTRCS